MSNGINVIKRNGDKDSLNLAKVHKMVEHIFQFDNCNFAFSP